MDLSIYYMKGLCLVEIRVCSMSPGYQYQYSAGKQLKL